MVSPIEFLPLFAPLSNEVSLMLEIPFRLRLLRLRHFAQVPHRQNRRGQDLGGPRTTDCPAPTDWMTQQPPTKTLTDRLFAAACNAAYFLFHETCRDREDYPNRYRAQGKLYICLKLSEVCIILVLGVSHRTAKPCSRPTSCSCLVSAAHLPASSHQTFNLQMDQILSVRSPPAYAFDVERRPPFARIDHC